MNSKICMSIIALTLLAALAISVQLAAQETVKPHHPHQYHHYQIVDPGTFGGPQGFQTLGGLGVGVLNNAGAFGGWADTSAIDPLCDLRLASSKIPPKVLARVFPLAY